MSTTTTWQGIYLRPNLSNQGTVPASGDMDECPDIWIAGKDPIADFGNALVGSYGVASPNRGRLYRDTSNLVYVRGKNGSTATKTVVVSLYRIPEHSKNTPSFWLPVLTDQGQHQGIIEDLAPGAVGVCDQPFVLPADRGGYDDSMLLAHLNDLDDSNPFPAIDTVVSPTSLVKNNLGFGLLDTDAVFTPDNSTGLVTWSYVCPLVVPYDFASGPWEIYITPNGFTGWKAQFYATRFDSAGGRIALDSTTVSADGVKMGIRNVTLNPGFRALITVTLTPPGSGYTATPGARAPITITPML